jgi:hypothetical protein
VQDGFGVAAVDTPCQQNNVRLLGVDFLHIIFGELVGVVSNQLGPCSQTGQLCCLGGQLRHQANGYHPQPAGGTGTGQPFLIGDLPCLPLQFHQSGGQPLPHIGFHGGIRCGSPQQLGFFLIHSGYLGVGAAKINQQYGFHAGSPPLRYSVTPRSSFRAAMVVSGEVPGPKTRSKPMALNRFSTSSKGCLPTTTLPPT